MIFGNHQQNTLDQFAEYRKTATKSALLGDAHYGVVAPRLPDVLAEQGPTINVLETLKPIIVVMAGANDADHYYLEK
jgi:hypothetical protein